MSVSVLLLSLFVRTNASVRTPRGPACVQVFRCSTCKRNVSECPCAPAIDRDLEDGKFHQHRIFLSSCNIITRFRSQTVFSNKVILIGTSFISHLANFD